MDLKEVESAQTQVAFSNTVNKKKPITPLIKSLFKYDRKGSKTTAVKVAYSKSSGKILPVGDRSSSNTKNSANSMGARGRDVVSIESVHVTAFATLDSEEVQDLPTISDDNSLETFEDQVQADIDQIHDSLSITLEMHALGALKGQVKDKDGSVLVDLFDKFKIEKATAKVDAKKIVNTKKYSVLELQKMKSKSKEKLKGRMVKGFAMLCGPLAFQAFMIGEDVQNAVNTAKLKYLLDGFEDGFNYQNIDFIEYDGGIGEEELIGESEALLVPIVDGMFQVIPTPGVGSDHVNNKPQKTYITTKVLDHNVGVELKGQSNYLVMSDTPDAVVHITIDNIAAALAMIEEAQEG
mgnify:CR=1 FL=1